jgi:radical SAM superfamily enzyme YgiQ (UPF0313 family)
VPKKGKRFLFRLIVPSSSHNVFSKIMKKTIALGPVMVATSASKLIDWDVEIIHEAGARKWISRDKNDDIDHEALQKQRPADVVGIYCGISETMNRVFGLIKLYKKLGSFVVVGGKHVQYEPLEALCAGADIAVNGEGETTIRRILINFQKGKSFDKIAGIFFLRGNKIISTPQAMPVAGHDPYLENLPYPDFGLIRDVKIKEYPIGRVRGCGMKCEFCSVKEKGRWASAEKLFETVKYLVETRKAKHFFIVDDRVEEDKAGFVRFLELVRDTYGRQKHFTVQGRLEAAKDKSLLSLMRDAGVRRVCIGYESPINEELQQMRKGYRASHMISWTREYHRYGFFIHAMFIFGYPGLKSPFSAKERMRRFKRFIRKSRVDSIQVLKPIPLVGSDLRVKLNKSGRLLPLSIVPWEKYDGNHACFIPDPADMSVRELQEYPTKIMKWFYYRGRFLRLGAIGLRTLAMPFDYILRGWRAWYRGWRNDICRFGGSIIYQKWKSHHGETAFIRRIDEFRKGNPT